MNKAETGAPLYGAPAFLAGYGHTFVPLRQILKYLWFRFVGAAGSVMAMSPASNAGCK